MSYFVLVCFKAPATMQLIAILCVCVTLFGSLAAVSFTDLLEEEWQLFKSQFKKAYNSEIEEKFRQKIYLDNKHTILRHNRLYENGEISFKLGMNHFGDMLHHEFVRTMNGYKSNLKTISDDLSDVITYIAPYNVSVPNSIDWRSEGAVTEIKNQKQCGSCWSFSATGALEGQHFRNTGKLVSLSEQNLMDCSIKYGNNGCEGGLMDNAFRYVRDNKGLDTEKSYPYEAKDDKCRYNPKNSGATDKGFVDLPEGDEEKLKIAVATIGPISVAIDASHKSMQFYKSGVYVEQRCSSSELDHGVLVVGYGTENGQDYWLVKNSWGTVWGEHGYIKMARNKKNMCGIATAACYPLV